MPPSAPNKQKDPVQVGLRNHKRQWNANYKDVSQKLKAFKNGLNGKGDAKFSVPPSDIKSPFPAEIGGFLDTLAGEFQALLADAHGIIQEQDRYSKVRRKRKPKGPAAPKAPEQIAPTAPQPGAAPEPNAVVDTLSRLGAKYDDMLEVYASNKLTRLWQYMGPPFRRKQFNKQRLALLSLSADLYYSLLDFENEVLSLKLNSIPRSLSKYQASRSTFDAIKATIEKLADTIEKDKEKADKKVQEPSTAPQTAPPPSRPQQVQEKHRSEEGFVPRPSPSPQAMDDEVKQMYEALNTLTDGGFHSQGIMPILRAVGEYKKEKDPLVKSMLRDRVREEYDIFTKSIMNEAKQKYGPGIKSPQDVVNVIRQRQEEALDKATKKAQVMPYFTKEAHNRLTRFLKRQLVKARSYNSTAGHRLEIVETVDETKKLLQQVMNSLEDQLDPEMLIGFLETLNENMQSINKSLAVLITLYEQEFYKKERRKPGKKNKGKKNVDEPEDDKDLDQFTDYLMRRKVRRDMSKGIM